MHKYGNDFTRGNVDKLLMSFAMPFLAAQLLQAFYSVADMLIAGRFMGDYGISAINISSVLTMFISTLVSGFALSGTVLVAQYIGAKQPDEAKKTIATIFTLFIIASAVISILGLVFADSLLNILNTPKEVYTEAKNYLCICFGGTIFICGYNGVSAVLRGLGDSKRPLYFVIVSTVINIVLDILFMGYFNMGAAGAAWATVIAQAVSFMLAVHTLYAQKFLFDFKPKSFRIDSKKIPMILKIGLPSAVQSGVIHFSMIFIVASVNPYGIAASTAVGIGSKIDSFAILPGVAFSQAIASMAGQNIGAKNYDRARDSMLAGLKLSMLFSLFIFIGVRLFSTEILELFNCTGQTVLIGENYIRLATYAYLFNSVMFAINGLASGAGIASMPMITAICNLIIVRVPLIFLLERVMGLGLNGIFLGIGLSQIAGVFTSVWFYFSGKWRRTIINE